MLKVVFCLRRLPSVSREEFARYWNNEHSEVIRSVAPVLGIRRNVHNVAISTDIDGPMRAHRGTLPDDYDGIAESWFDSLETLKAAAATEQGRRASRLMHEDEMKFVDFANSKIFFVEETVAYDASG